MKVKLQCAENECVKKGKLIQELIIKQKTGASDVPPAHKEASLAISLRQKIQELERENARWRKADTAMQKDVEFTKVYEIKETGKAYEKECKRLRVMLEEFLAVKYERMPTSYAELEAKILDLKATIKELRKENSEMSLQLHKLNEIEGSTIEIVRRLEYKESKIKEQSEVIAKQKLMVKELKERLIRERNSLDSSIKPLLSLTTNIDVKYLNQIEELKVYSNKLKKENEQLKRIRIKIENELVEVKRELTKLKHKSDEERNEDFVRIIEANEKLTQRLHVLEKELAATCSNAEVSPPKPELTAKPLVRDSDLVYTKALFRVVLIQHKRNLSELEEEMFGEYRQDEYMSIKELVKVLQRQPLGLDGRAAEDLGRYLVEGREKQMVAYDKFREQQVSVIKNRLKALLSIEYPRNFYVNDGEIVRSALGKVKERIKELKVAMNDVLLWTSIFDYKKWKETSGRICPELTPLENDYLVSLMAASKNLRQLNFNVSAAITQ